MTDDNQVARTEPVLLDVTQVPRAANSVADTPGPPDLEGL
jgi:hypothetical protein